MAFPLPTITLRTRSPSYCRPYYIPGPSCRMASIEEDPTTQPRPEQNGKMFMLASEKRNKEYCSPSLPGVNVSKECSLECRQCPVTLNTA